MPKYDITENAQSHILHDLGLSLAKTILGIYSVIACRSHYTIDVVISLLLTNMVFYLREKHIHKNTGEYFARYDMV